MKILFFAFSLTSGHAITELLKGYDKLEQPYNAGKIRTALRKKYKENIQLPNEEI